MEPMYAPSMWPLLFNMWKNNKALEHTVQKRVNKQNCIQQPKDVASLDTAEMFLYMTSLKPESDVHAFREHIHQAQMLSDSPKSLAQALLNIKQSPAKDVYVYMMCSLLDYKPKCTSLSVAFGIVVHKDKEGAITACLFGAGRPYVFGDEMGTDPDLYHGFMTEDLFVRFCRDFEDLCEMQTWDEEASYLYNRLFGIELDRPINTKLGTHRTNFKPLFACSLRQFELKTVQQNFKSLQQKPCVRDLGNMGVVMTQKQNRHVYNGYASLKNKEITTG